MFPFAYVIAAALAAYLLVVAVLCMRRLRGARLWQKLLCSLFPVSQISLVAFVFWCAASYGAPAWVLAAVVLLAVACGPLDALVFRALNDACGHFSAAARVRELEDEVATQAMLRERSKRERQEADAIRERIRVELEAAERDLRSRRASEAGKRLGRAVGIVGSASSRACQHPAVDSLIGVKARDAKQAGVRFQTQLNVPPDLAIPSVELCAVFSNLVDNALNACQALPPSVRYVNVTARRWGRYFVVDVENSCAHDAAAGSAAQGSRAGAGALSDGLSDAPSKGADGAESDAAVALTTAGTAETPSSQTAESRVSASACKSRPLSRGPASAARSLAVSRAVPDMSALHGWGQGIVADIASRHGGQFTAQREGGRYRARAILKVDGGDAQ